MFRRWDIRLGIAFLLLALTGGLLQVISQQKATVHLADPLPTPSFGSVVPPAPAEQVAPSSGGEQTESSEQIAEEVDAPPAVTPGLPTKMYLPGSDPALTISAEVYQMPSSCRQVIDPPSSGQALTRIYACSDFDLPGSTSGLSVLTGHSSPYQATQLNKLDDQVNRGELQIGSSLYVATETTPDGCWLSYEAKGIHQMPKAELPNDSRVWDNPDIQLAVVTCKVADTTPAPDNLVVTFAYKGMSCG